MRIAVYAIALNEARHVGRWFASCRGADEIVLVDTGSSDGTLEAARALGITTHSVCVRPFRFDVARNAALALVPADVDLCLSLDLDEVAEPEFFSKLRSIWLAARDRSFSGRAEVWYETAGGRWKDNIRLHRRHGCRWIKPCHEITQLYDIASQSTGDASDAGDAGEAGVLHTDLVMTHRPDLSKSRAFYLDLLRLAVREDPQDARMWHYLVREYGYRGDWAAVVGAAEQALTKGGWSVERASVCRMAAQACAHVLDGDGERAWLTRATKEDPSHLESWYDLAFLAYSEQAWQACWDAASVRLRLRRQHNYLEDADVWRWKCYDLMSISSFHLGRFGDAVEYARVASSARPEDERLRANVDYLVRYTEESESKEQTPPTRESPTKP